MSRLLFGYRFNFVDIGIFAVIGEAYDQGRYEVAIAGFLIGAFISVCGRRIFKID